MGLFPYIVRRLILTIPILIGITLTAFVISHAVPADPVMANLGQRAQDDPSIVARYRHQYGLDQPLPTQYVYYIGGLLHGDLGISISSRRPVVDDLKQYFPATLELSTAALLLALLIGVPLGVLAAVYRNRLPDHLARVLSLIGISTPVFWLGLVGSIILWYHFGLLPAPNGQLDRSIDPPPVVTGLVVVDALLAGNWTALGNALWHLLLPASVLAAYTMGIITRITRGSLLEVLVQDYIRTARAKGVHSASVVLRHGLRNAIIPTLTLAGLSYGSLLSGAVLTETIFAWPGIGLYATRTAGQADFPAILGVALLTALIFVILNLVVDVLYAVLNPQVRLA
ncbi:MAG TPA: ABC transporter permease [Chloroflexota bacterium]|nr:ABC transporter permease [Chloroflexota bacterium]